MLYLLCSLAVFQIFSTIQVQEDNKIHTRTHTHVTVCSTTLLFTSAFNGALQRPHHKTVFAHTNEAAKSVLARPPWWTHILLTLVYIWNTPQINV